MYAAAAFHEAEQRYVYGKRLRGLHCMFVFIYMDAIVISEC